MSILKSFLLFCGFVPKNFFIFLESWAFFSSFPSSFSPLSAILLVQLHPPLPPPPPAYDDLFPNIMGPYGVPPVPPPPYTEETDDVVIDLGMDPASPPTLPQTLEEPRSEDQPSLDGSPEISFKDSANNLEAAEQGESFDDVPAVSTPPYDAADEYRVRINSLH